MATRGGTGRFGMGVALLLGALASAESVAAQAGAPAPEHARAVLSAVRGASPLLCDLAARTVAQRHGGWAPSYGGRSTRGGAHARAFRWAVTARPTGAEVDALLNGIGSADACERRVAALLLGRSRGDRGVDALVRLLANAAAETRAAAALALGLRASPRTLRPMTRALGDAAAAVRATAAWALGRLEDPRAVDALIQVLERDPSAEVRAAAAEALGRIG